MRGGYVKYQRAARCERRVSLAKEFRRGFKVIHHVATRGNEVEQVRVLEFVRALQNELYVGTRSFGELRGFRQHFGTDVAARHIVTGVFQRYGELAGTAPHVATAAAIAYKFRDIVRPFGVGYVRHEFIVVLR